ncbi:MAG: redoxin domain-containing protein [Saprospiraceae bacterium]|nr:redoxin domain-containing protein [Saprospiraceae bacterium]
MILLLCHSCVNRISENFIPAPQVHREVKIRPLEIGASAPDFHLPGADGSWYRLNDFDETILVVAFLSNYCPNSQVYEDRLISFYEDYKDRGVDLVVISPNSPLATPDDAMGYSDLDDSYESMVKRAKDKNLNYPYLYDGDHQNVSVSYGFTTIPTVFVFDEKRHLQYRGQIDGSSAWRAANAEDLRMAVDAVERKGEIIRKENNSPGCKVYWSWDQADRVTLEKTWMESPVNLQKLTLDSLMTLRVNFSHKPRVFNFWATWCGPCKQEFPEFLKMQRMYRDRPIEFISVSLDSPEKYLEALTFLQQLRAPGSNFILQESDKEAIRKKVYDQWDGSLPFTIIVDPLGLVYKVWQGPFDPLEVKKAIVEHRLLGRYYSD